MNIWKGGDIFNDILFDKPFGFYKVLMQLKANDFDNLKLHHI